MMAAMAGRMGMPGSRKQQRSKKGKKGKKGARDRRRRRCAEDSRRSARRVPGNAARRSSRGDAGFVEHAEGPGRIAARTRGHRPVPAEAAEEVADGCTALPGTGLPDEQPVEFWVDGGVISTEPVPGAETVCESGWIVPGLVDAHCHVGIRFGGGGGESVEGLIAQAETERDCGVLLIRDAGSPVDTRFVDNRPDLPRIIRAGQHIAVPKRYIRGLPVDLEDESQLPDEVVRQARAGDGWVKLVGDWIDRSSGDLAPLWSDDILVEAIAAAHREGLVSPRTSSPKMRFRA